MARRGVTWLVAAAAAVVLSLAVPGVAFAAGTGYAPPPATPTGVPGGFNAVVTTATIQPSGGALTGTINGDVITVTVPAGAFTQATQVVLTSGDVTQIGSGGIAGKTAVLAFGISFVVNGQSFAGTFPTPVTVTVKGNFTSADELVSYNSSTGTWEPVPGATVANGVITFTVTGDPNFAVLASSSPSSSAATVPGATTPVTGKPFLLEGLLAVLLVLFGGVAAWRLSRSSVRA